MGLESNAVAGKGDVLPGLAVIEARAAIDKAGTVERMLPIEGFSGLLTQVEGLPKGVSLDVSGLLIGAEKGRLELKGKVKAVVMGGLVKLDVLKFEAFTINTDSEGRLVKGYGSYKIDLPDKIPGVDVAKTKREIAAALDDPQGTLDQQFRKVVGVNDVTGRYEITEDGVRVRIESPKKLGEIREAERSRVEVAILPPRASDEPGRLFVGALAAYPEPSANADDQERRREAVFDLAQKWSRLKAVKRDSVLYWDGTMNWVVVDSDMALNHLGVVHKREGKLSDKDWERMTAVVQLRKDLSQVMPDGEMKEKIVQVNSSVEAWMAREGRGAGEIMRRVTRQREAAPPPPERPRPPEGEAVPADGGSEGELFWHKELGSKLKNRDGEATDDEIAWLLRDGVLAVEPGVRKARFDQKNEAHLQRAYEIAVRAARQMFFGFGAADTGLSYQSDVGEKEAVWTYEKGKVIARIKEIFQLWERKTGDERELRIFEMALTLQEIWFGPLAEFQWGQGDLRKQKGFERHSLEISPKVLENLVEMVSEHRGVERTKKQLKAVMREKKVGVREALEELRQREVAGEKGVHLPRFTYFADDTDDYDNIRAFNFFENRFGDIFSLREAVKILWQPGTDLLGGQKMVGVAREHEGKTLGQVQDDVRRRLEGARLSKAEVAVRVEEEVEVVRQVREAVKQAVSFRGELKRDDRGALLEENSKLMDESGELLYVDGDYKCKDDKKYVVEMPDWVRQNIAMARSLFGIPRVYTAGTYEVVLPELFGDYAGYSWHVRVGRRMPWKEGAPWVRKYSGLIEGETRVGEINYIEPEEEMIRDMRGEGGISTRSRYAKGLFDCPQTLDFINYWRLRGRGEGIYAWWENYIRKVQVHRSRLMFEAQLLPGSTFEIPVLDGYHPVRRPELMNRRWGVRRDIRSRAGLSTAVPLLVSWVHPEEKTNAVNEDLFGMVEASWGDGKFWGVYAEHRLLSLGFSADRALEMSEICDSRGMMAKRLVQFITDFWFTDKGSAEKHEEARDIIHRGAEGFNRLVTLMRRRLAGMAEHLRFENAGVLIEGWDKARTQLTAEDRVRYLMMHLSPEQFYWLLHPTMPISEKEEFASAAAPWRDWDWVKLYDMVFYIGTTLNVTREEIGGKIRVIDEAKILQQWQENIDAVRFGKDINRKETDEMEDWEREWFADPRNNVRLKAVDRIQRARVRMWKERGLWGTQEEAQWEDRYPLLPSFYNLDREGEYEMWLRGEGEPDWNDEDFKNYVTYQEFKSLFTYSRGPVKKYYGLDFPFTFLENAQDLMSVTDYIIGQKYGALDFNRPAEQRALYKVEPLNWDEIMLREYCGVKEQLDYRVSGQYHRLPGAVKNQIKSRMRHPLLGYEQGVVVPGKRDEPQFKYQFGDKWDRKLRGFIPTFEGQSLHDYDDMGKPLDQRGAIIIDKGLGDKTYSPEWVVNRRLDWPDTPAARYSQLPWLARTMAAIDHHYVDWKFGSPQFQGDESPYQRSFRIMDPWTLGAHPGEEGKPLFLGLFRIGKPKQSVFQLLKESGISNSTIAAMEVICGATDKDAKRHRLLMFWFGIPDLTGGGEIGFEDKLAGLGEIAKNIPFYDKVLGVIPAKYIYGLTLVGGTAAGIGGTVFGASVLGALGGLVGAPLGFAAGVIGTHLVTVLPGVRLREKLADGWRGFKVWDFYFPVNKTVEQWLTDMGKRIH